MAEKPDPNNTAPATDDQKSTGPAVDTAAATSDSSTYYLKPGKTHFVIVNGRREKLAATGAKAELTNAQYSAFKDKFFTAAEYKAHRASKDALSEGAQAAALAPQMEQTDVESHQNADNEDDKDNKSKTTSSTAKK